MQRIHSWMPALMAVTLGGAGALACSNDDGVGAFSDPDAGGSVSTTDASVDGGPAPSNKPPFDPTDESVVCEGATCAVELAAGDAHFCARMNDGTVRCWGENGSGVLGHDPSEDDPTTPKVAKVDGLTGAKQLSIGGTTACALVEGGAVQCWGNNADGQLGLQAETPLADQEPHATPAPVALPGPAVRIDVGPRVACAVLATGEAWCWGFNGHSQLGRKTDQANGSPGLAPLDGIKVTRTAHGSYTSFAVTEDGDVVSWGAVGGAKANLSGRLASTEFDPNPLPIGLEKVTALSVSSSVVDYSTGSEQYVGHACAIGDGNLYCWGLSRYAALGTGSPDIALTPTLTGLKSGLAWPQRVAAGGESSCVRITDGTVQCAGDNRTGNLARGNDAGANFSMGFTRAAELEGHAVGIGATKSAVCALLKNGSVACWGSNATGQLGQGTKDDETHGVPAIVKF